jgi:hypothetical protein
LEGGVSRISEKQIEEKKYLSDYLERYKMEIDYITLRNGRKVRLLYNSYVEAEFIKLANQDSSRLFEGKCTILEMRSFLWLMATEGEKADNKELGLSEKEFGRLFDLYNTEGLAKFINKLAFSQN